MHLEVGDIIHIFIRHITPSKNKYVVCVQGDRNWFLLINTENREMYDCVEISSNNYGFLKEKNRYISCSRIFELPENELSKAKVYGKLKNEDLNNVFRKIRESRKLSPVQKNFIIK